MRVKPNAGLQVRDPALKDFLPEEGREVDDNDFYWHRRLRDKDVILVQPPMEQPLPAASKRKGAITTDTETPKTE